MEYKVRVLDLLIDEKAQAAIITLGDPQRNILLPMYIGIAEASSIAIILEKIAVPRPFTHDLIKNIFDITQIKVIRILIDDFQNNTFFAKISLGKGNDIFQIDCRPSDAIAIAVRTQKEIYISEQVLEKIESAKNEPINKELNKHLIQNEHTEENAPKLLNSSSDIDSKQWKDLLESLSEEDFGKYKM